MTGLLEEKFEFELNGIDLQAAQDFHVPKLHLQARLESAKSLIVTVDGMEQIRAGAEAEKVARELYVRMLLRFGEHITSSSAPRSVRQTFTPAPEAPSRPKTVSLTHAIDAVIAPRANVVLSESDLKKLVQDVESRVVTPQVVTSAPLYTAIDMYAVGLESKNTVVRFLIFYSAVTLAALFKRSGDGSQRRVDGLLLTVNPHIPVQPSPRDPKRTETLYTKLRNDLVHAEERGCDPAKAIAALEAHIPSFQQDVASVLLSL